MNNHTLQIVKDDPYLTPYAHIFQSLHKKMDDIIGSFGAIGGL